MTAENNLTPIAPVPPVPLAEARFTRLSSLLDEWNADSAVRHEAKQNGLALGPKTGLPLLDTALTNALMPGLHHVHGSPGVGKTALALQIGASCGCPCLYVTCEMAALELLRRITARVTTTQLQKFKTGDMTPAKAAALVTQALNEVDRLDILDATQAPASAEQIGKFAAFCRPKPPASLHLLIIIDSLNSWAEGAYPNMTEYEQLNAALAHLRQLASHLSCPILVINERNRMSMKGGGLNAGAGSRKIEYGAESVIDLDRAEDAKEDSNGNIAITLKIGKNRHGVTGKPMSLNFHGAFQRYEESKY